MGYLDEECKGCLVHAEHLCSKLPTCGPLKCPCLVCLIKGICENDCEAIEYYAEKVSEYDCKYKCEQ